MSFSFPTFPLVNKVRITNPAANLDARYGPWPSTLSALSAFDTSLRDKGLTVGILDGNSVTEYWWKDGTTNNDLIIKQVPLSASNISGGRPFTKLDDTNITLTLSGNSSTALLNAVVLSAGWVGQLPVSRGGTGSNNGSIAGTGTLTFTANGTNNIVLSTASGEVDIGKVDIDSGTIDNVTIGGATAAVSISSALLNVDNIQIDGNTISSTNLNGNITFSTNGIGNVVINRADINGGAIDNTTIGLTTPDAGKFTSLEVTNNLLVEGNLTVQGSATYINTQDLIVRDPIIYIAESNPSDILDIGLVAAWTVPLTGVTPTGYQHGGLVRRVDTKKWTLFRGLTSEPLSGQNLSWEDPTLTIETLVANVEGTLTGNVSGTAAQAVKLTNTRTISAGGDISYVSEGFDGSANVVGTATINNNVVSYAKLQEVTSRSVIGNPTASTANAQAIPASVTGFALLSATSAAAAATTIGLGTTNSVTFNNVAVNNGTKSVLNNVYHTSGSNNLATLNTFASGDYYSAKYTVQIRRIEETITKRCALEILATNHNGTWEGTVYGIVDPAEIFANVGINTNGGTVNLTFGLNGNEDYTITAYAQALSD
jgi:hypothetical protein